VFDKELSVIAGTPGDPALDLNFRVRLSWDEADSKPPTVSASVLMMLAEALVRERAFVHMDPDAEVVAIVESDAVAGWLHWLGPLGERISRSACGAVGMADHDLVVVELPDGTWSVACDDKETHVTEKTGADIALGLLRVAKHFRAGTPEGAALSAQVGADAQPPDEARRGAMAWSDRLLDLAIGSWEPAQLRHLLDSLSTQGRHLRVAHDALRERYDRDLRTVIEAAR
jgi:hypothetical protein